MTCAACNRPGILGFDLFTYYFGKRTKPDGKVEEVHQNAHRECADALYAKWRKWRGWV